MRRGITRVLVISLVAAVARSQAASINGINKLHAVQGLYVQPSSDGTTGDLYVAASEDSGSKTQWLTDQPINFLPVSPVTAATQSHQVAAPVYTSTYPASSHDESQSTQKRAVITPSVQYAYAFPMTSSATEGGAMPYPYAIPAATPTQAVSTSTETSTNPPCADISSATAIPYNPFQFFYPHMMSAYANAKSVLKESGMSDDKAGSVMSQATPAWSPYGAYPMYVMVDPSAWAQAATQTNTSTANNEK